MARITRNGGMLLLGIYLILQSLVVLIGLSFAYLGTLLALLALVAGVLLLLGR
jgi:hypothetical protein